MTLADRQDLSIGLFGIAAFFSPDRTTLRKINVAAFTVVIALLSSAANAVLVQIIDGSGKLIGASGVIVGTSMYEVAFIDGTCESVYSGCDEIGDFAFFEESDAFLASQALLDQVFVDTALGMFDSSPNSTTGCAFNVSQTRCFALTPVGSSLPADLVNFPNIDVIFAGNAVTEPFDGTLGPFSRNRALYDSATTPFVENAVWAKWTLTSTLPPTPMPEPGTLGLLGAGALGLAWRRRRIMREHLSRYRLSSLGT